MTKKFEESDWQISQAGPPERPLIVRAKTWLPDATYRLRFSELVAIRWNYEPDDRGLPSQSSMQRMCSFETAIENILGRAEVAIHVCCSTGNDFREWMYYTTDQASFMTQFNEALCGHPIYPLHIEFFSDIEWSGLRQIIESTQPRSTSH